jgi:hypothetical protein
VLVSTKGASGSHQSFSRRVIGGASSYFALEARKDNEHDPTDPDSRTSFPDKARQSLLVTHLLHPIDVLAADGFLDGDVRHGYTKTLDVGAIVDCTGIVRDPHGTTNPAVRSLFDQGLARPDPLRIGVDVGPDCAIVRADGVPSQRLFAVGPLTRAAFWECLAVESRRKVGSFSSMNCFTSGDLNTSINAFSFGLSFLSARAVKRSTSPSSMVRSIISADLGSPPAGIR